ncbi:hypothetical protein KPL70_017525 [Citrus sinensis]|nr:hypothetical protein KPL70_017525 [Citrus sinensis]
MEIQGRIVSTTSHRFWSRSHGELPFSLSSSNSCSPFRPLCSRRDSQEPQRNGDNNKGAKATPYSLIAYFQSFCNLGFFRSCHRVHGNVEFGDFLYIQAQYRDKFSTDWDKAWSNFKKQGKKSFFSQFSPNKYVSWNPRRSDYPPSEEVDPIKRTERSNLMLWTSPQFTLVGAIVIVTFLLVYTILAVVK